MAQRNQLPDALTFLFCTVVNLGAFPAAGLHYGADQNVDTYAAFEQWIAAKIIYRVTFADRVTWNDVRNPWPVTSGGTGKWLADARRYEVLTVPLTIAPNTFDENHDADFRALAQKIKPFGDRVIVRLGWEANGDWYPWNYVSDPEGYKRAFRRAVFAIRSVANVRIDWNISSRATKSDDWRSGYPGDDVVDIISMDIYDHWNSGWSDLRDGEAGLKELRAFALSKNKPEAYPEWAVVTGSHGNGDNPSFITNMYHWFDTGNVLYQAYWNHSDVGARIFGSTVDAVNAAEEYKKLFGSPISPSQLIINN